MKKHRKAFVAGVFDNFHIGHQYLLWKSLQKAETMVVIVARDINVEKQKKQKPSNNEEKRLKRVKEEFLPRTNVRLGREDRFFWKTLQVENPDILILGYDQNIDKKELLKRFPHLEIYQGEAFFPQFFKSSRYKMGKSKKK